MRRLTLCSFLLLVGCSSVDPVASTASELQLGRPKLRVALFRAKGCTQPRTDWEAKALFRKAPGAVEKQMCLYAWKGPRGAVDLTSLELDDAERCALTNGWDLCSFGECEPSEARYLRPDPDTSAYSGFGCYSKRSPTPSGGGGGCEACGLVADGRAWVVYGARFGETRVRLRVHGSETILADVELPRTAAFFVALPPVRKLSHEGAQVDVDVLPGDVGATAPADLEALSPGSLRIPD